jgi:hypothetical protein
MSNETKQTDHIVEANKMITAVEWVVEQFEKYYVFRDLKNTIVYQQAKVIEKEHIVDAHIEGQRVFDNYPHTQWTTDQAEQYYNETFTTNQK